MVDGNFRSYISIITPTYNHKKCITGCIESVIKQTYPNWEMIIVDDGSTDGTAEIAEEYAVKDSRIRVIRQENKGIFRLAETYNKALHFSIGTYIAVLEGDDFWMKDKLEKQIGAFRSNPEAVLCWGQAICRDSESNEVIRKYPPLNSPDFPFFNNDPAGSILNVFLFRNCIPALTMLIKKEALMKIGGFRQNCGLPLIDLPTLYELALAGKFLFIPEPLGFWNIYPTQITKIYTAQMMEGCKCLAFNYIKKTEVIQSVGKNITENKLHRYYNGLLVESYSRSGRYKLIRKEFGSARKDYIRSIFRFGLNKPVWKIRSMIGFLFSLFHRNVEGLSRILGKKSYA